MSEYSVGRPRFSRAPLWGYGALVLTVLCAAGLVSCAGSNGESTPENRAAPNASDVTVAPGAKVERKTLSTDLTLTGEFIPHQEVDVMAKEAGYIKSIRVD